MKVPLATVLGMHLDALAQLLVKTGDLTPHGQHLIRAAIREHLPTVTFDDGEQS